MFMACKRRIEHTHQHQIFVCSAAQIVLVMLIEYINIPWADRIEIALHILDFTFAGNAVARL
ncbi:hypothetical protein ASG03_03340 [Rhizobium sp. Leaf341]|nr:hypothetical protein ASG03_03340 [Rhizobium sp. Leaf341]